MGGAHPRASLVWGPSGLRISLRAGEISGCQGTWLWEDPGIPPLWRVWRGISQIPGAPLGSVSVQLRCVSV